MRKWSELPWHAGLSLRTATVFYAVLLAIVGGLLALIGSLFGWQGVTQIAFFWILACIVAALMGMLFLSDRR